MLKPRALPRPPAHRLLDEAARLQVLRRYSVLDTPPEHVFDRITELAAEVFDAPIATIAFIDESRQWFKSRFGIELQQTPRHIAFCDHTIRDRAVMVVLDAAADPRFALNPLVTGDRSFRFYAGAPIVTAEGGAIGTLSVIDRRPRPAFGKRERAILRHLTEMVLRELELRAAAGDLHRDISEKIEARAALARGEEIFRLALDRSPVGVFTKTRSLIYDWAFNSVCGRSAEALIGRRAGELFPADDAAYLESLARGVMESGEPLHAEIRCRAPDSPAMIYTDYRLEPLRDPDGGIEGVVGIAIDVTEETRLQRDAAQARARAEAAVRSKSHFLAAANHDLRQPFQAMRLFADILAERLRDSPDFAVVQRLSEAMRIGEDLLRSLLEMSQLDAETVTPAMAPVAIRSVVAPLVDELAPRAADKGLTLRHCIPDAVVVSDAVLLRRILRHLIGNAIRFSRHGKVLVGGRLRGDRLHLQVWDTGIGIPRDQLRAVFEPFYQLDNPERDRAKGLGLGLAIVEKSARLLGHGLGVASQFGRGTVFTISMGLASKGVIHS